MFPDIVEIFGAFDTRSFFAPASTAIATITGDATMARVTLQTGTVLVYTGTDLTFSSGVPTGGTVTAVSVLTADDVPLATLTLTHTPWNFADITTDIPYQNYLATRHGVLDTLSPALSNTASMIFGGNQDDEINLSGGADTARGLAGDDTFSFFGSFFDAGGVPSGVVLDGGAGFDTLRVRNLAFDADGTLDVRAATIQSIERLSLLGGTLHISAAQIGSGRIAANSEIALTVGSQLLIDQVAGRTLDLSQFINIGSPPQFGDLVTIRVIGTDVADRQIGNALFNDILEGNAGNDRLSGRGGFDTLDGGEGDDTLFAGDDAEISLNGNRDVLYGGDGNDRIIGGIGDAFLVGGAGNDRIIAGVGASSVFGDEGDDWLTAGTAPGGFGGFGGLSSLYGGAGNDTISSGTGGGGFSGDEGDDLYIIHDDLVFLFEAADGGNDTIRTGVSLDLSGGEFGSDAGEFETIRIIGQAGLSITGTITDNRIVGNTGADTLNGGEGADRVEGGRGADVLTGGTGADTLIGGADADRFVFATGFGADRVADFMIDIDVIDLTGLDVVTSFADLVTNFLRQDGRNVVIDTGVGDVLTLADVRLAALDAADFLI
jgi:Ca2+-binding RTX toxin-like protein